MNLVLDSEITDKIRLPDTIQLNFRAELNSLVKQIITISNPLKLYLFGSYARKENTSKSDFDILVIVSEEIDLREITKKLYLTISDIKIPYDIIVSKQSIIEKNKNNRGLVYSTILAEGVILYAK